MKKKYYHISNKITKDIKEFIPRIPATALPTEDHSVDRVCLCENIIECFNAVCYIDNYLKYNVHSNSEYRKMKVYEFILDDTEITSPEKVLAYVPDALHNKECWATKIIKPINSYVITPTYFQVENSPIGCKFIELHFDIVSENVIEELKKNELKEIEENCKKSDEFTKKFGKNKDFTDTIINMWNDILNN